MSEKRPMTEEEIQARKKRIEKRRAEEANMTPEEIEASRKARKERAEKRRAEEANMTPEEIEARRKARKERAEKRRAEEAGMTPEEIEASRKARKERAEKRRAEEANLTPEEIEARRAARKARHQARAAAEAKAVEAAVSDEPVQKTEEIAETAEDKIVKDTEEIEEIKEEKPSEEAETKNETKTEDSGGQAQEENKPEEEKTETSDKEENSGEESGDSSGEAGKEDSDKEDSDKEDSDKEDSGGENSAEESEEDSVEGEGSEEEESEEESEEEESDEEDSEEAAPVKKKKELTPEQKRKRKLFIKSLLSRVGVAVFAVLVIYGAGSFYYMNHFYPNTTLNGLNVSNRSAAGVKQKLEKGIKNYQVTITEKDGTEETVTGEQIGLALDWDREAVRNLILSQPAYDWFLRFGQRQELTSKYLLSVDDAAVIQTVESLPCMEESKQVEPIDATIVKSEEKSEFVIQDEVPGTVVNEGALIGSIQAAANAQETTINMEECDDYKIADVTSDNQNLQERLDTMNYLLGGTISYQLGEEHAEVLDSATFYDWITLDEHLNINIDEDKVIEYVDELAKKYDNVSSGKYFKTYYGTTVYIPKSTYGWKIDKTAEVAQIIKDLKTGEQISREMKYSQTANSHNDACWGGSYIEVNITKQHVYMFKNGSLVCSTDCVTGCTGKNRGTSTGVWKLINHSTETMLVGQGYNTLVHYWMKFTPNGQGLHDAYWRGSFGGNIYKTNGSHGCVNLPSEAAKTIYNNIEAGYPIIVYTDDMAVSTTEASSESSSEQ